MRKVKTKKKLGLLLAAVLLFQLSYHTLHVFTAHLHDSHFEHSAHDTQIGEASLTCELCAKLLGQALYLWVYPILAIAFIATFLVIVLGQCSFEPKPLAIYSLRGPPFNRS